MVHRYISYREDDYCYNYGEGEGEYGEDDYGDNYEGRDQNDDK